MRTLLAAVFILASVTRLHAGDVTDTSSAVAAETPAPSNIKASYEFDADTSYVGGASTDFGSGINGDVSENRTRGHFVVGVQDNGGPIYRFGLAYQRYSFGFSQAAPLPDILQSENLVVGVDFELFNSWLVRVEADPGLYGDGRSVGYRDFNVPFTIGGSYITGEDLQWVVGMEVDVNRQIPVIPAVGLRWVIHDQWVLDAILPTPRLEYDWSKDLTLYIGGDVDDGTFRVDQSLGTGFDNAHPTVTKSEVNGQRVLGFKFNSAGAGLIPPSSNVHTSSENASTSVPSTEAAHLGGSIVEYDEIRVGAGLSWKPAKGVTLELEAGYLPYREFDFHRADVHFSNQDGAAYGQMSFNAQF